MIGKSRHSKWYHRNLKKCRAANRKRYRREVSLSRDRMRAKGQRAQLKKKEFIRKAKNGMPCMDCGELFPYYVLDFDHVRGEKKFDLNRGHAHSYADLRIEIAKCDVVCSNCHRKRTWRQGAAITEFGAPPNYMKYVNTMPEGI